MSHFIINGTDLQKLLQIVSPLLNKSSFDNQIFSCVLLDLKEDVATLKASNGDIATSVNFNCEIKRTGSFAVSGFVLSNIAKEAKDLPIELKISDENENLLLVEVAKKSKYKINTIKVKDKQYDFQFDRTLCKSFTIESDVMKNIFAKLNCCVADSKRPNLHSILMHSELSNNINNFFAVSTDGLRLGVFSHNIATSCGEIGNILLPKKLCEYIKSLLPANRTNLTIFYKDNLIQLIIGQICITAKLVDGEFPKYQAVLSINNDKMLEVKTDDIVNCLKKVVAISSTPSFAKARLSITKEQVEIICEEEGNYASDQIEANFSQSSTKPLDIMCNASLLLEILQNIDSSVTRMTILDGKAPILIRSIDDINLRYVFMPMSE
jgi:DNA polymerase-3 subunit beta